MVKLETVYHYANVYEQAKKQNNSFFIFQPEILTTPKAYYLQILQNNFVFAFFTEWRNFQRKTDFYAENIFDKSYYHLTAIKLIKYRELLLKIQRRWNQTTAIALHWGYQRSKICNYQRYHNWTLVAASITVE